MGEFVQTVKVRVKNSSQGVLTFLLRLFTSSLIGLTFALVGEVMIGYGSLAFVFVLVAVGGTIMRIARNWSLTAILVFNIICVLLGLLLRMYINIAPGA